MRCRTASGWSWTLLVDNVAARCRYRTWNDVGCESRRKGGWGRDSSDGQRRGWRQRGANPFKSTQLRQWGFICYLEGHIVSRRERTDRLRRASDSVASTERRRHRGRFSTERLYHPAFYFTTPHRRKNGFGNTGIEFFLRSPCLLLLLYHSLFSPSSLFFSFYFVTRPSPILPKIVPMHAFSISGQRRLFRGYRLYLSFKGCICLRTSWPLVAV